MAANNSEKKERTLPPGWEKRIDLTSGLPYFVDHNTKTTHWTPPPPVTELPTTPPNKGAPLSSQSNQDFIAPQTLSNSNKTLPGRMPINQRHHSRASTMGSAALSNIEQDIYDITTELDQMDALQEHKLEEEDDEEEEQEVKDAEVESTRSSIPTITHKYSSITSHHSAHSDILASLSRSSVGTSPLQRKASKPYSNTTDQIYEYPMHQRVKSKPLPPPPRSKRTSSRPKVPMKPPPYSKTGSIPPPPPRDPSPSQSKSRNSLKAQSQPSTPIIPSLHGRSPSSPPMGSLGMLKERKPEHSPVLEPAGSLNASSISSKQGILTGGAVSGSESESEKAPTLQAFAKSNPAQQFYRDRTPSHSQKENAERAFSDPEPMMRIDTTQSHSLMDTDALSPSNSYSLNSLTPVKTREHAKTTGGPVLSRWNKAGFSAYKDKLAKKYKEKKQQIKEKRAKKKGLHSGDEEEQNEQQQKTASFLDVDDLSMTQSQHSADETEYSVSLTSTNPLAPTLPPNMAIKPTSGSTSATEDSKQAADDEEEHEITEFYTLSKIVEIVTSPEVRGNQDQTVLLHTYSLYSTRQKLLCVILSRLQSTASNNRAQIKVLSLLRTWLKTEDDFKDCPMDDEKCKESEAKSEPNNPGNQPLPASDSNLPRISPTPSCTDPPLDPDAMLYAAPQDDADLDGHDDNKDEAAHDNKDKDEAVRTGLDLINEDEDSMILTAESEKWNPALEPPLDSTRRRHKIGYGADMTLPPFVKLSPFAAHFRQQVITNTRHDEVLIKLAQPILTQLSVEKKRDSSTKRDRTLSFADAPTPKIPRVKLAKDLELSKLDAKEIARQICLMEYNIFKKIKPEEFLKQKSTKQRKLEQAQDKVSNNKLFNLTDVQLTEELQKRKKEKEEQRNKSSTQPNIDKMTEWFNGLVIWAQIELLNIQDLGKRAKALATILKICAALEKYNNVSSLCAIRAGLCSAPIHRLRKTWEKIPHKAKDTKARIDELFKLGNGQKNLRDRVAVISQPAIPHLGLFLGDIVFIHDGNETFEQCDDESDAVTEPRINWTKMKLLADRINWISMFQQAPFIFQTVPIIHEYLEARMKGVPEDFLYRLSRQIEPPEKK